jgi:hypothetical protein
MMCETPCTIKIAPTNDESWNRDPLRHELAQLGNRPPAWPALQICVVRLSEDALSIDKERDPRASEKQANDEVAHGTRGRRNGEFGSAPRCVVTRTATALSRVPILPAGWVKTTVPG